MLFDVSAATVAASAGTETGIGTELAATAAAAAAALTTVMPMGADLDSAQFAAALNAAGAAYLGTAAEHAANRALFGVAQGVASATYTAADAINKATLAL